MGDKYKGRLYCFSPPVMVATCIIEITLLIYTLWRYKFTKLTRLIASILFLLAVFQLAEFRVCRGFIDVDLWSHIGYVAITLLPPIGIHAINTIKGNKNSPIVYVAYATSAAFVAYFALTAHSLTGHQCLGNYVIFQVNSSLTWLYGLYYYGWVIAGGLMSIEFAKEAKNIQKKQAFRGFALGYAAFLVPTTTMNLLDASTRNGIPSIMCGFAVLFALITTLWVMPRAAKRRSAV